MTQIDAENCLNSAVDHAILVIRRSIKTKALLRVQFLLILGGRWGEEQEALALLSEKGGEGGVYRESAKV